jgi:hypothetical protein
MSDFQARTRSWLMVAPIMLDGAAGTCLYFGSVVVPVKNRKTGTAEQGGVFRALLDFNKIYPVVRLRAAVARLNALRATDGRDVQA